jgi:hypothetical protein
MDVAQVRRKDPGAGFVLRPSQSRSPFERQDQEKFEEASSDCKDQQIARQQPINHEEYRAFSGNKLATHLLLSMTSWRIN